MIEIENTLQIVLPSYVVEKCHYQAKMKEKTVGGNGSPNRTTQTHNLLLKDDSEKQMDQMISEMAFSIFLYGFNKGIGHFMMERQKHNLNPNVHDHGNDMIEGVDVKSRRKKDNFFLPPIDGDLMNYDMILRPHDFKYHKPNHKFFMSIHEYPNSLLEGFDGQTATVWLVGWAYLEDFPPVSVGDKEIRGERTMLGARSLYPVQTLFSDHLSDKLPPPIMHSKN